LRQDPRVIDVSPKVMTQVFFRTGAIEMAGVVNGVDVVAEEKLFHFSEYVIEGNMYDLATVTNCVFIGKGIAQKMMVNVGDVIQVTAPNGEITSLKIGGILQFGLSDVDDTQSYASLQTVQKLLGETASYVTDLNVKLKDINIAPDLAKEFAKTYEVDTIDIQTANSQFETGSTVRSIISYAVGITLLIVAGFGVYNILNMMIYEKMDSIAILKATGFSGADVKAIFISLSMIIGITGGICGLLFGFGLSVVIDNIPFNTAALPTIKTFPIYYTGIHYVIGIVFSIVTTYIAGLFPARKAGRIDPVVIIRGK
jgi:lipoprotein-releasing system permease protein